MKPRVLIHVDSLRRDGASCITLAHILRQRECNVTVSGQQTTAHYLKFWRPHIMLHTAASKISAYHKLGLLSPASRPIIHYLPQEGRPTKPASIRLSYQPLAATNFKLVDKVYVWNKPHRDWLKINSPLRESQVQIVGGYRLDLAKYGSPPNFEKRPPLIGFIGRFTALSPHDGDYGLHLTAKTSSALTHKLPKITAQVRACMIYSYLIHKIIEETNLNVSLRPHHNEYPHAHFYVWAKKRFGARIHVDQDLSFYEWAAKQRAVITSASSTFAELAIARTPLICVDNIDGHEISLEHDGGSKQLLDSFHGQKMPTTFNQVLELLRQADKQFECEPMDSPTESLINEQYTWPYNGSSLLAIANDITGTLQRLARHPFSRIPVLPKISGDLAYAIGMWQSYRSGTIRQRINYVYNDWLHGGNSFYKSLASRILQDEPYNNN